MAITSARCSCTIMPLDSSRTRCLGCSLVLARKRSQRARSKRGWTPATKSIASRTFSQRGSTATSAMKQMSFISSSRCSRGSRPSTLSSPSTEVRPRMAFNAVVLPAPLGPIRPMMRPLGMLKLASSRATVVL
ncbi:hypothetical protein G6F65_018527 [Rhizopus arrhizus]|nr:hypothetical protein G6F65_018527 [Rhizopus arrhizus]